MPKSSEVGCQRLTYSLDGWMSEKSHDGSDPPHNWKDNSMRKTLAAIAAAATLSTLATIPVAAGVVSSTQAPHHGANPFLIDRAVEISTAVSRDASHQKEEAVLARYVVQKRNARVAERKADQRQEARADRIQHRRWIHRRQVARAQAARRAAEQRAAQEAAAQRAARHRAWVASHPAPAFSAPVIPVPMGSLPALAEKMMLEAGFPASDWSDFNSIIQRESGYSVTAQNPSSGAYGLGQALPASKMAPYGSDYMTDPATQLRWMLAYIKQTYGNPVVAWQHELTSGWY